MTPAMPAKKLTPWKTWPPGRWVASSISPTHPIGKPTIKNPNTPTPNFATALGPGGLTSFHGLKPSARALSAAIASNGCPQSHMIAESGLARSHFGHVLIVGRPASVSPGRRGRTARIVRRGHLRLHRGVDPGVDLAPDVGVEDVVVAGIGDHDQALRLVQGREDAIGMRRRRLVVLLAENDDTATTPTMRRSSAAACNAIPAPSDTPITAIGFASTRSSTRRRSCFS